MFPDYVLEALFSLSCYFTRMHIKTKFETLRETEGRLSLSCQYAYVNFGAVTYE